MNPKIYLILYLVPFVGFNKVSSLASKFHNDRRSHKRADLSNDLTKDFAYKTDSEHFEYVLDEILIPRVVGTPQHKKVANFIVDQMEQLGWDVERHSFTDNTPLFGQLEFQNIIAKLNPKADRFLILACHYDSKYVRENNFVGATDSAVPCAMMLNIAKTLQKELNGIKNRNDVSLAFIFFDGEEAFINWTSDDSIYGARNLAAKWASQEYVTRQNDVTYDIDRIDMIVLLDLLGAKNPRFYNYFPQTQRWYKLLVNIERRLNVMGMLNEHNSAYFAPISVDANIQDDHIPFMRRNVPILHLIPTPFPEVWHQPTDDRSALHSPTIENLNKILRVFVAEYLHLNM